MLVERGRQGAWALASVVTALVAMPMFGAPARAAPSGGSAFRVVADEYLSNEVVAEDGRFVAFGWLDQGNGGANSGGGDGSPVLTVLDTKTMRSVIRVIPDDCTPTALSAGRLLLATCPGPARTYRIIDTTSGDTSWGPAPLASPGDLTDPAASTTPVRLGTAWIQYGRSRYLNWRTGERRMQERPGDVDTATLDPPHRPCAPFARSGGYADPATRRGSTLLVENRRGIFLGRCGGPRRLRALSDGPASGTRSLVGGWTAWLSDTRACRSRLVGYDLGSRRRVTWGRVPDRCLTEVHQTAYAVVVRTDVGEATFYVARRQAAKPA